MTYVWHVETYALHAATINYTHSDVSAVQDAPVRVEILHVDVGGLRHELGHSGLVNTLWHVVQHQLTATLI